jgi:hypothetical protein
MNESIFDLTEEQIKKFKALEKAYNDCIKANMLPVNIYGSLTFYNKKMIKSYNDDVGGTKVSMDNDSKTPFQFKIPNEWADDKHFVCLTKTGQKIYEND